MSNRCGFLCYFLESWASAQCELACADQPDAALTPAPDAGGETPTTGDGWQPIETAPKDPQPEEPIPAGGRKSPHLCGDRCLEDRGEGLWCALPAGHDGSHAFGSIAWRRSTVESSNDL